jgi:hypothetical protein
MPFPSSSTITLNDALKTLREGAGMIKTQSLSVRATSLTGTLTYPVILNYMGGLKSHKARMDAAVAAVGASALSAYAQEQLGSATFTADYSTMLATVDATVAWIAANLPKDGSNYALAVIVAADGATTDRVFTSGQLAGFRTNIDALTATIS